MKKLLRIALSALICQTLFFTAFGVKTAQATAQEMKIHVAGEVSEIVATPAPTQTVILDLYYGEGCPHCRDAKTFLSSIQNAYPNLEIREHEVYHNLNNRLKMQAEAARLSTEARGVPFIVIGDTFVSGFQSEETTGAYLVTLIEKQSATQKQGSTAENKPLEMEGMEKATEKSVEEAKGVAAVQKEAGTKKATETQTQLPHENTQPSIEVPFLGKVTGDSFSLPVFTILIAVIDGFNPCAMWTLLFLISLLLGMKDTKRMWLLGTVFIITSAAVYFLFLSAWLSFFSFFGYLRWLQLAIGVLALGSGAYYLKDFLTNKNGACKVTSNKRRQHVFAQLKVIAQKKQLALALVGIIFLAIAVNLVEVICSAGLPAIYTKVLSMNELPTWQYYLYLVLYIAVFMIDDLFVFFTAMMTLKVVGIENKYARFSHGVGGVVLLLIGLLLIIKPELLMFG